MNGRSGPVSDHRTRWRSLTSLANLHLGLLSDLQRIVDLDAEILNCAFEFRVPEQQLNSSEISGPPIDHRSFRTSHIECVPYVAASKPIELTHEQSANTAEWKDAVTLTRGSEAKIALVLDVQPRSMRLPHP